VFALGCEIVRRLKRNGVLRSDWSRGLAVAAVDGIEIYSSFVRCCDACMERELQHKVNGEMQTGIQYYHRIAVVAVVSTPFPIPLGLRFQKNGEGEVACASALLRDLDHQLGRRFLDVLVDDALSSGHGIGRAHHDPISCLVRCRWSSITVRFAAMRAENARHCTSAPGESPIGSPPLPPTQVDFSPLCGSRSLLPEPTANLSKCRSYCIPSTL